MLYIYVKKFNILVKKKCVANKITYMLTFLTLYEKKRLLYVAL